VKITTEIAALLYVVGRLEANGVTVRNYERANHGPECKGPPGPIVTVDVTDVGKVVKILGDKPHVEVDDGCWTFRFDVLVNGTPVQIDARGVLENPC
jgi:hypothetical protein